MGCSQSKIENEEAVSRCKDRKQFMKLAVAARNAFAAAHSSYSISVKNCGAALSDFATGEVIATAVTATVSASVAAGGVSDVQPPPPPMQNLPPPPPPIPDLTPPPPPLQRALTMPEFSVANGKIPNGGSEPAIVEEEFEEVVEEEEVGDVVMRRKMGPPPSLPRTVVENGAEAAPPPPPPLDNSWDYFFGGVENMPGSSLGDVEEIAHKVFAEMPKRNDPPFVGKSKSERMVEVKPMQEKMAAVEKLPLPPHLQKNVRIGKQNGGHGGNAGSNSGGGGEVKRRNVSLVQVFTDLDDCFLAASESAQEVTKLLEAARLHFHSNFADKNGHIDHSARVMQVITWNRSIKGLANTVEFKDDFDSEENETHATVLDKLLAWEKKLYDEVKAGEIMKYEYQRKVSMLNKQKKRSANTESLEKIKATVSHLHTRYIVDMQTMDSTVSEINRLRDEQLYPRLVTLVDAMTTMWSAMQGYHEKQLNVAHALRAVDISKSTKETTDHHHDRTIQLWGVVQEWHMQFDKMVIHQKEYIRNLNSWLKLNLIPIESNLKEKVSSPPRAQNPPIQNLLLAWHDLLEKLPDEHAKSAIHNFGEVLHTIVQQQEDELKLRAKVEESTKDLEKKKRQYEKWLREYTQRRAQSDEAEGPSNDDGVLKDDVMVEKEFVVENAKKKLDEDRESYERQCLHVREKSLTSLKTRLPELFRALSDFARASSEMYSNLKFISDSKSHERRERAA